MEDFIEYLASMVDSYKVGITTRDELEEAVNQTQKRFHDTRKNKKEQKFSVLVVGVENVNLFG